MPFDVANDPTRGLIIENFKNKSKLENNNKTCLKQHKNMYINSMYALVP